MHQFLHGNFMAAFRYNPLMPVGVVLIVAFLLFPKFAHHKWTPWALLILVVGYGVLRNVFDF